MDSSTEPVSNVSPVFPGNNPSSTDANSSASAGVISSDDIHSRLCMSDEQREIRRRFEEKQREEARRSAQAERIAKKKANSIPFVVDIFTELSEFLFLGIVTY